MKINTFQELKDNVKLGDSINFNYVDGYRHGIKISIIENYVYSGLDTLGGSWSIYEKVFNEYSDIELI